MYCYSCLTLFTHAVRTLPRIIFTLLLHSAIKPRASEHVGSDASRLAFREAREKFGHAPMWEGKGYVYSGWNPGPEGLDRKKEREGGLPQRGLRPEGSLQRLGICRQALDGFLIARVLALPRGHTLFFPHHVR